MTAYTVHAPPDAESLDPAEAGERMRFVKDGFSWPALFFAPLWILWHGMWVTLVWYVAFVLVVAWTDRLLGEASGQALFLLGSLFFAFEANDIRRRSLRSKGWTEQGGSVGRNKAEAEIRYFGGRAPAAAVADQHEETVESVAEKREALARAAYPPATRAHEEAAILGLFPEPER